MGEVVPFARITDLFEEFEHTAWRLESRRQYASDLASARFAHFLANEHRLPQGPDHPWKQNVRRQLALGKTFGRVRTVDDPLTDNQRFLLASALESPEDIRVLRRTRAEEMGLPAEDVWIFDSKITARLVFDEQDRTLGVVVSQDPADVVRVCQIRDAAQHYAVPSREFAAALPSGV